MTSIAETDLSTGRELPLREVDHAPDATDPRLSRRFNVRAYLAGGAATTALVAGAILVFASLAAYVAFNGFPVIGGDENASQLTVAAEQSSAPEAAAAALGRASGAVAATAAAANATAPAPGNTRSGGGTGANDGSSPSAPGGAPGDPSSPVGTPTTPTPTGPGATGPVGGAVNDASNATNLPLDDVAGGPAQQVDDVLHGVGGTQATQQVGDAVGGTLQGAGDLLAP